MSSIQVGDYVDVKNSPARQLAVVFVDDHWLLLANGEILTQCDVQKIEGQSWVKTSIVWSVVKYLQMSKHLGLDDNLCPGDMVVIFDEVLETAVIEPIAHVDLGNCRYLTASGRQISVFSAKAMSAGWSIPPSEIKRSDKLTDLLRFM